MKLKSGFVLMFLVIILAVGVSLGYVIFVPGPKKLKERSVKKRCKLR